jgi:hypothetical protein
METLNERVNDKIDVVLKESSVKSNQAYVAGMSINSFMDFIHGTEVSSANDKLVYDQMMNDGTVSSVINAYMADLVVRDKVTNHVCNIVSDDAKLVEELESFLYDDIKIDDNLSTIALRCFCYGCSPVELCSIDSVTDKQWELYVESVTNSIKKSSKLEESLKTVKPLKNLTEDQLNVVVKGIKKRWYINILSNWRLKCLETKGKTIAYIDPDDTSKVYDGKTLVAFLNKSATDTTTISNEDGSDTYTLTSSESFLDKAKTAYKVLSAFEDLLLIHALTTSINYRIFQVDVGTLGDEETVKLLQDIKKRINENESFNVENSFYNSSMTGVPMGASIIVPTRGGIGTLNVQQIDNQFGTDQLGDFNYFKDKLANALMSNPAILGNSTNGNGGLATGAATEVLDERAHQFIEKYRLILASNIENLCDLYLQQTRTKYKYSKIAKYSVRMSKNTSRDQVQFLNAQEAAAQSLQQVLRALDDAEIKLGDYPETRIQLFRQFLGDELADTLNNEYKQKIENGEPTKSKRKNKGGDDFDLGGMDDMGDMGDIDTEIPEPSGDEGDIEGPIEEPGVEI